MASAPTPAELCSWKEIASYLGVSIKTAQSWERDRGLPVRRYPGRRVVVRAVIAELEEWKTSTPRTETPLAPVIPSARSGWLSWHVAAVIIAASSLGAGFLGARRAGVVVLSAAVPLTSDPGVEFGPDLSPDGRSVIYMSNPAGTHRWDLMQLGLDGGSSLIASGLIEGFARWSPDGRSIAFPRAAADSVDLVLREIESGSERK